jgi:predicted amino acid dehydrogenase
VGFLSHLINDTHAKLMDPLLRAIGEEGRERFVSKISEIAGPFIYHEQILEAPGGRKIHLHCYAVFSPSSYFEKSHREGNGLAMRQVQQLADRCRADQMDFIGLGQYTSIVSRNGLLLRKLGIPITTGNGLTAGFAYRGILKALADTGRSLEELKVGVVGAGGNICSVVTQLLADHAKELGLIFREGTHKDPKAQAIVKGVVENSKIKEKHITVADRMNSLLDCDVVLLGTSSAKNLLFPQHLKKDAIVMDVSVPSNIDPSVFTDRNDVKCYQGARATLPMGQILRSDWIPVPKGETYACMAETLAAGFLGLKENLSFGPLSKEGVLKTLDMARRTGIEMGSLKRTTHNDRTL